MSTALGSLQTNPLAKARATLVVVLASETAFFGTLVMAYLYLRSQLTWPAVERGLPGLLIPILNTSVLLVSALAAGGATAAIRRGRAAWMKAGLLAAFLLGAVFVAGQAYEFIHSGMRPSDATFGGVFFALMSFHALHVLAGMVILGLNLLRAQLGDFDQERHVAVAAGGWFWYYVCAVWLVLFTVLYLV